MAHIKIIADPIPDANGNITLRVDNGTPNGDTNEQPIATVYEKTIADLIVRAVNKEKPLYGMFDIP